MVHVQKQNGICNAKTAAEGNSQAQSHIVHAQIDSLVNQQMTTRRETAHSQGECARRHEVPRESTRQKQYPCVRQSTAKSLLGTRTAPSHTRDDNRRHSHIEHATERSDALPITHTHTHGKHTQRASGGRRGIQNYIAHARTVGCSGRQSQKLAAG